MKDVMIDAEWLGERVASVALVMFDPKTGDTGAELYCRVKWKDTRDQLGGLKPETVYWWFTQPVAARDELLDLQGRLTFSQAANAISRFVLDNEPVNFWQRGDADRAVLEAAIWPHGGQPWEFWQWRDVRTITTLTPVPKPRETTHHALNDAYDQIQHLHEALKWIGQA